MNFKQSIVKAGGSLRQMMPMLIGVLLLAVLANNILQSFYTTLFTGAYIRDSLIGALAGSLSFGMPLTSYVVGGELLQNNVSLLAVTAFIMTWTTVGVIMLPLEMKMLGGKFAVWRNVINFIFAIIISILTVIIVNFFR
jgi:hypothetical protein